MNLTKILHFPFGLMLLCSTLSAQTVDFKGSLLNNENNTPISGGVIFLYPDKLTSVSNSAGEFFFRCKPGIKEISVRALGYKSYEADLNIYKDSVINIYLQVSPIKIKEVRIIADSKKNIEITDYGSFIISPVSFYEVPRHFSEPDLLKTLQFLPGVVSGKDGSSDIFVRGGTAGQNIVLANGCYFFLPSHLLGIVSPYDLDFIEKSELIKDYFPADLGGGASSIIKLDFSEQKSDSLKFQARLGFISTGITFETPIKKLNLGLTGGLRLGNYFLYSNLLKAAVDKTVSDYFPPKDYSFYDGYLRLIHSSVKLGDLSYLLLVNHDDGKEEYSFISNSPDTLLVSTTALTTGWNSMVHALRWTLPFKGKIKYQYNLNLNKLSVTRDISLQSEKFIHTTERIELQKTSYSFSPLILNIGTSFLATYDNDKSGFSGGLSYRIRNFSPNIIATNIYNETRKSNEFLDNYSISEPVAFLSTKILLLNSLNINFGLRLSGGFTKDANYTVFEPRIRISLYTQKKFSPHLNFVRLSQFDHSVEGSNAGLRSMLWLPISKDFGPEISDIYSAGIQLNINKNYIGTLDGYYKNIKGMVDFKPGASFLYSTSFSDLLDVIRGKAYGIEAFLIKRTGKLTGSISYTYSRSEREWGTPDGLIWIPSSADRPHCGNLTIKYNFTDKLSFGLNWVYSSGVPATIYIHNTFYGEWYETKNNIRYPSYHRLDLSLRRTFIINRFLLNLDFDIYNAYNRKNTYYLQKLYDQNRQIFIYKNVALFPIMPSVTITLKY